MATRRAKTTTPPTADEVPVTCAMLTGVRTEIIERIHQTREEAKAHHLKLDIKIDAVDRKLDAKIDAVHHKLDAKIDGVHHKLDAKIDGVHHKLDAKIDGVHAELRTDLQGIKVDVHEIKASVARMEVLLEEQNARNKIVLDGLAASLSRHDQAEARISALEENFRTLAGPHPAR